MWLRMLKNVLTDRIEQQYESGHAVVVVGQFYPLIYEILRLFYDAFSH